MDQEKISKLKETSVTHLLDILENHDDWLEAAAALAELGNTQGVEALINALEHPDESVRVAAENVLKRLNDPKGNLALQNIASKRMKNENKEKGKEHGIEARPPRTVVIEDTRDRMVLKSDTSEPHPLSWGGCLHNAFNITAGLFILVGLVWIRTSFFATSDKWLFMLIAIIAVVIEGIIIALVAFLAVKFPAGIKETTISLDAVSQRALSVEILNSGKVRQQDLELTQVKQIVIRSEENGHGLYILLEKLNDDVDFSIASGSFVEDGAYFNKLGTKLGTLLKKPVVLRYTESGKLLSEEILQG